MEYISRGFFFFFFFSRPIFDQNVCTHTSVHLDITHARLNRAPDNIMERRVRVHGTRNYIIVIIIVIIVLVLFLNFVFLLPLPPIKRLDLTR